MQTHDTADQESTVRGAIRDGAVTLIAVAVAAQLLITFTAISPVTITRVLTLFVVAGVALRLITPAIPPTIGGRR